LRLWQAQCELSSGELGQTEADQHGASNACLFLTWSNKRDAVLIHVAVGNDTGSDVASVVEQRPAHAVGGSWCQGGAAPPEDKPCLIRTTTPFCRKCCLQRPSCHQRPDKTCRVVLRSCQPMVGDCGRDENGLNTATAVCSALPRIARSEGCLEPST
jgi:hypothetical protein